MKDDKIPGRTECAREYYYSALDAIQPNQQPVVRRYTPISVLTALMKIVLMLGVLDMDRREFWRFFTRVMVKHPTNAPDFLLMVCQRRMSSPLNMRESQRVFAPPGQKLLTLAEIFFSPKTVRLTFEPLIADWQFEYFEALKANFPSWRLRIISIRYCWHYAKACGLSKVVQLFRAVARK
jgi:hypothetical protein